MRVIQSTAWEIIPDTASTQNRFSTSFLGVSEQFCSHHKEKGRRYYISSCTLLIARLLFQIMKFKKTPTINQTPNPIYSANLKS